MRQGISKTKKKVFIGMSGGVDSSVSSALLKKAGYDVSGVFIKVWQPAWIPCTWKEDRLDAMRVATLLNIPFITLDLTKEYKKEVVDYMIQEYKKGKTPNPDVMCNRHIKFGGFYKWAMSNGADYVATGHYARVVATREIRNSNIEIRKDFKLRKLSTFHFSLLAGSDQQKDQSYFLWQIRKEQLSHIMFPVGNLKKPDVRKLALKFGLPNAKKKDSQGLCFIGKVNMKEFLSRYIKSKEGKVLNQKGEVIGRHVGAIFYTEGERHGFLITKKSREEVPLYVLRKNVKNNTLIVGDIIEKEKAGEKKVIIKNCNWIGDVPKNGKKYFGRIRYRQPLNECKIMGNGTKFNIIFKERQKAVSSGQSLVLYDGNICIGGGIIE